MDRPKKPAKAPQLDPELEKYSKHSFVGLCGCVMNGEFRAVMKYIWSNQPSRPRPQNRRSNNPARRKPFVLACGEAFTAFAAFALQLLFIALSGLVVFHACKIAVAFPAIDREAVQAFLLVAAGWVALLKTVQYTEERRNDR